MDMLYWPHILVYVIFVSLSWCQKVPLESVRRCFNEEASQNICLNSENDVLHSHSLGKGLSLHKGSENDMVELIKRKFINLAGNKIKSEGTRKSESQDDPNVIQALMSRAFIDNANYVFHKNDIKEEDSGLYNIDKHTLLVNRNPKVKQELNKTFSSTSRGKRDILTEQKISLEDSDESEDSYYEKREKSKNLEGSEVRIHCVRAGPSEAICKHENYTYSFKLPADLFNKKVMENLVSSVCSIVGEASHDGGGGGKVEIAVKKNSKQLKKERDNKSKTIQSTSDLRELKEDPDKVINKVIRINIPIDFSAIPLGVEDDEKLQNDISDKEYPQETKHTIISDNSATLDKSSDQIPKKNKFQPTRIDDSCTENADQNQEALMKQNDFIDDNCGKDEYQEKWLNKRDNLQNPMVFPPSLILFKRSPDKLEKQSLEQRPVQLNRRLKRDNYNVTSCKANFFQSNHRN